MSTFARSLENGDLDQHPNETPENMTARMLRPILPVQGQFTPGPTFMDFRQIPKDLFFGMNSHTRISK
jgi:hypothetical protein